ncbi:response regulator [Geobacter argillaceus]|uniref:Two-component system chemotaxis response regulator CheY n=1 Tax=Geobacter argillaceus TaxID=345631 RepID=A0A562WS46_9BACT|nr:response regulator [Geobacter argillaceus]TWJ33418.1 two-component system chemotaxis response regulator CheY [Geobacter argillaceus]
MENLKCLIVDDDELGRGLIAQCLEGTASCTMATDGNEAVEQFMTAHEEGTPFDLIILDIVMPNMDGHAAGKEIRRIEKERGIPLAQQVKIIVLTALNTPQDVMNSFMSSQPAAHLVKPVEPAKLRETLGKVGLKR